MRGRISLVLNELRFSYWFVPAIMALGAMALSVAVVTVDKAIGGGWFDRAGWIYANRPEGARALLSTIAGSMITVAGVTFSITVAAVASSTNQFGPRLLTNFLRDRGNQITLGTFIATFLYCLLVLRTVVSAGEAEQAFVPNIGLLFALILAIASVGVLIFFLHHVPQSVHISHMVVKVGRALIDEVGKLYPRRIGEPGDADHESCDPDELGRRFVDAVPVPATGHGYVQQIDGDRLVEIAVEHGLVIRIECRPGVFVRWDLPLARVLAARAPDDALIGKIRKAFTWDVNRSPTQDVMFLVDQLVEVAARALSRGINDPFTAMNCMEWLTAAMVELAGRRVPGACRFDDSGELRVVARPIDFAELREVAFASLLPYLSSDRNAAMHAMASLASLAKGLESREQKAVIREQAAAYFSASAEVLPNEADQAKFAALYAAVNANCT